MSAYRLVQEFEDRKDFPVYLNEVRDAVIRLGVIDRIAFKGVDIDQNILRGICYRYHFTPAPYAVKEERIDVLYANALEPDWRRLVVTKELIHTLDKPGHSITKEDEVSELVRRMARRPELRDPMNWHEASDRVALFQALGILFPFGARDLIRDKYNEGVVTDEMIAHRAGIPHQFVSFLMSDDWTQMYDGFMRLCEADAQVAAE